MLTTILLMSLSSPPAIDQIEDAHGADELRAHPAIRTRIELDFGGKPRVHGLLFASSDGGRTRIEFDSGKIIVFDGQTAWLSPADASAQGARFDALTWSYFMLAAFKLKDPGARWAEVGKRPWKDGAELSAAKLSFGQGVGDAPDDWYVVYADPESHALLGLAYIVTFGGRSQAQAEAEPHAIAYERYADVEGVKLPSHWSFWLWSEEKGVFGEPLGRARLEGFELMKTVPDTLFRRPAGAVEVPAP
ncbi:MAG: hypothetical protein AAGD10_04945 [Myxococcota bacterium]